MLDVTRILRRLASEEKHCHNYKNVKRRTRVLGDSKFTDRASARGINARTRVLIRKSTRRQGNNRIRIQESTMSDG